MVSLHRLTQRECWYARSVSAGAACCSVGHPQPGASPHSPSFLLPHVIASTRQRMNFSFKYPIHPKNGFKFSGSCSRGFSSEVETCLRGRSTVGLDISVFRCFGGLCERFCVSARRDTDLRCSRDRLGCARRDGLRRITARKRRPAPWVSG